MNREFKVGQLVRHTRDDASTRIIDTGLILDLLCIQSKSFASAQVLWFKSGKVHSEDPAFLEVIGE